MVVPGVARATKENRAKMLVVALASFSHGVLQFQLQCKKAFARSLTIW
jgi:hypothetical protein